MLNTLLLSVTDLMRRSMIFWRWLRYSNLPWRSFGLACWQLLWTNQPERSQLRFAIALARLDHLAMVTLLNDCLW